MPSTFYLTKIVQLVVQWKIQTTTQVTRPIKCIRSYLIQCEMKTSLTKLLSAIRQLMSHELVNMYPTCLKSKKNLKQNTHLSIKSNQSRVKKSLSSKKQSTMCSRKIETNHPCVVMTSVTMMIFHLCVVGEIRLKTLLLWVAPHYRPPNLKKKPKSQTQ